MATRRTVPPRAMTDGATLRSRAVATAVATSACVSDVVIASLGRAGALAGPVQATPSMEPRIEHGCQCRVSLEVVREREGRRGRAAHPDKERAPPTLQQPGLERTEHGTGVTPPRADAFPKRVVARRDHRTSQDVAVAIEIFRGRVDDAVSTVRQGSGEYGGCHCTV